MVGWMSYATSSNALDGGSGEASSGGLKDMVVDIRPRSSRSRQDAKPAIQELRLGLL